MVYAQCYWLIFKNFHDAQQKINLFLSYYVQRVSVQDNEWLCPRVKKRHRTTDRGAAGYLC